MKIFNSLFNLTKVEALKSGVHDAALHLQTAWVASGYSISDIAYFQELYNDLLDTNASM